MKSIPRYKSHVRSRHSKITFSLSLVMILLLPSCNTGPTPTPKIIIVTPTVAPPAKATSTSIPTSTTVAVQPPTSTAALAIQPSPTPTAMPQAQIWSMSLEESYKLFYELGYSAEMYRTTDDYWAVTFYDPTSYYESDYWYWYGNSIYTFGEVITDLVTGLSITKNYLDFPVSGIDTRADKFFRRTLDDLGFDESTIDEIMDLMSEKLAHARDEVGEQLCYGQLNSGEYVAVWLEQSDWGYYWYSVDISLYPICPGSSGSEA